MAPTNKRSHSEVVIDTTKTGQYSCVSCGHFYKVTCVCACACVSVRVCVHVYVYVCVYVCDVRERCVTVREYLVDQRPVHCPTLSHLI